MLLRAVPRSLRAGSPILLRPISSSPQIRSFAKNNRPRRHEQYKAPARPAIPARNVPNANVLRQSTPAEESHVSSSDNSGKPDSSTSQEEFETSPASEKNTAPKDTPPSSIDPAEAKAREEEIRLIHDLTKGIPSTIDAELEAATKKDGEEEQKEEEREMEKTSAGGRGSRRMPASAYETSADRKRNNMFYYMLAAMGTFGASGVIFLGQNWESEEEARMHPDAPNGWGLGAFYNRIGARLGSTMDYYNEPAFPKLLPDLDGAMGMQTPPFTLVLSLEDLLIHSEWSREHGWRMAKRPGVDYFIRYLSQYYELVIFTSLPSTVAGPIVQKLDPFRIVMWPLFREATRYKNGEYIKDLSYLNRDLSKIILIDTDKAHAANQPENAIILPKWTGDSNDKDLVALIPFLEYVAAMNLDDTRKVLSSFEGKSIPAEFAAREKVAREKFDAQLAAERFKRPKRSVGRFGSALGIKPGAGMETIDGQPSFSESLEQGKTLQDQIRERGQRVYEALDKNIRENGAQWLQEMAEEEKKLNEEATKNMKAGLTGWFGQEKK